MAIDVEVVYMHDEAVYLVDGKAIIKETDDPIDTKFGMLGSELQKYGKRGQATSIAQFYKLVVPGLILSRHIFVGLKRPLFCDNSMEGDEEKLIYTRKPVSDYEWVGGRTGKPIERSAPLSCVFAVIISPNIRHKETFPNIHGWIERWNWLEEDSGLPEAPIDWVDRYEKKIFTRRG